MKFRLNVNTDNDAFVGGNTELARILRAVADRIEDGDISATPSSEPDYVLLDFNGNNVGTYRLREED